MDWKPHIEVNPQVLAGKPVVKGTRLSVEFLLGLFAQGWSETQVLENYPQLSRENLQAVFAFSAACLHDEQFIGQVLAA
ncbi:uncharacterized protein (DUF433 family) [Sulfuritortus calidifontis]|uniref:Uncharacterized protein (DUF433 family) n=1 Tax=Sulfuritortus calidifontis TaxID=1914471 RepID=A0A4R3JQ89_9PROT|nr:DUF433 domain-containing protein [Sulfuritortus calidifontis]TCS68999.1 uncharacterized protein (DUF433 family) [Sulfuritortus calidifontis]